ncbi:MAG: type VI secretion system tip protein VgrG [Desulfobacterales bacterium]|nr:type VI secretion system tip protein VgrG [Desulfobacterales bacterium]
MPILKPADEAQFLFAVSGINLRVVDFTIRERISSPYEVELTLASEEEVSFDDVIGKEGLLTILGEEADRYAHGIVNQFMQTGSIEEAPVTIRFYMYKATVVPSLWLLSLEQDCRIFQNKSVPDIVKKILEDGGITGDRYSFRLQGQYQPRDYCVQYRETDLNFISRLLEEEGIFYFFEHTEDKHLLVFGDSAVNYQPIQGKPEVTFNPAQGMVQDEEFVTGFVLSRQIRTGKVTLRDFNFEKPSLDLTAQDQGDFYQKLEVYDYPGEYTDGGRGKNLAKVRLQEAAMYKDRAEGQSFCPRFVPGFTFKLADHELDSFNKEFLLAEIFHSGSQPQSLEEHAHGSSGFKYSNQFFGIPSSVTLRPERTSPKPIVEGVQTAIVVGPKGEEIYTDEHGRVKVQFHWDREGKRDEKSSCWIRVSQVWAGANWGAMYIPRIGHEVIVDFIEGDPDRPIITGRVYHGSNKPPYTLPDDKTKSTIKSDSTIGGGGFNEFRFEDAKGSEEIYLQGEKDWTILIKNDKNQIVGRSETLSVGVNRTKTVGVNQSESVGVNKTIQVGVDHTESIGQNKLLDVGKNHTESIAKNAKISIGDNETISIGKNLSESIGDNADLSIGKDLSASIGSNTSVEVGKNISIQVGKNANADVGKKIDIHAADKINIFSDKEIVLSAGKASIILKKNGDITIQGGKIGIKGSKEVIIKGSKVLSN